MRQPWREVYLGLIATVMSLVLLFFGLIVFGIYFHFDPRPLELAVLLASCLAAAGFYRGWKEGKLLTFLVGSSFAIVLLVSAVAALPDPILVVSPAEQVARMVYTPLFAAAPAAIGFALGRCLKKIIRSKSEASPEKRR